MPEKTSQDGVIAVLSSEAEERFVAAVEAQVHVGMQERLRAGLAADKQVDEVASEPLVLRAGGRLLCSERDPVGEASRWAQRQDVRPDDLVVVFGAGAGHHLEALAGRGCENVLLFEPDVRVLAGLLARRGPLAAMEVTDDLERLRAWVASQLTVGKRAQLLLWPEAKRRHPSLYGATRVALDGAVELATITLATLRKRSAVWIDHILRNLPQTVGTVPAQALRDWLAGRPAIIVAAGPSLGHNVQELHRVQGRAVIFAVNTSLGALERAGIRADLVVALEALDISEQLAGLELNGDVPRVLSICANPALFSGATGQVLPFAENFAVYAPLAQAAGFEPLPAGGSVANSAVALAWRLGAQKIILAGQDLAYRDDRVYAPGTLFEDMRVDVDAEGTATFDNLAAKERIAATRPEVAERYDKGKILRTPAWGGVGEVVTTGAFNYFRHVFERWATSAPASLELINATEGGARIHGFAERPLAEVIDELPAAQPGPWPAGPTISGGRVRSALEEQLEGVMAALAEANALADGDDESSEQADRLEALRRAVEESGLLHAHAWSDLLKVIANGQETPSGLGRRVAQGAEELRTKVQGAIDQL